MSNPSTKWTVGIREAKAGLSQLINKVKNGAVINITDRGQQVAQLIPFPKKKMGLSKRLQMLQQKRIISPLFSITKKTFNPLSIKNLDVQKLLREDRNKYS